MSTLNLRRAVPYLLAVALPPLVMLIRHQLPAPVAERPLLIMFMAPVLLVSLLGGLWPGLLTTGLSALLAAIYLFPPFGKPWLAHSYDIFQWSILVLSGALASLLAERLIRTRRRAEAAWTDLRASEARATALLNAVPDLFFRMDRHGRFLDYKADMRDLHYQSEESFVGKTLWEVTPQEFADQVKAAIDATLNLRALQVFEYTLPIPGKGPRDYEARMAPSGPDEVISITRDITERKQVEAQTERQRKELEEEVRQRTQDLRNANRRLSETQFAMDRAGVGVTWVDVETGRFLYTNDSARELLGYTESEFLALTVFDIGEGLTPEMFQQLVQQCRDHNLLRTEITSRSRDGRQIPVEVVAYVLPGEAGSPDRLVEFVTDISARKAVQQELERAKVAAETATHAKSAFLANMSHEIRTPLNAVLGLVQVMRRLGLPPEQADKLDKIEVAGEHLLEVINAVLDLSKIEAGKFMLAESDFEPERLLRNVEALLKDRAAQKGLSLQIEVIGPVGSLRGDPTLIQQALMNYAGNAVKFTENGGITLRMRVLHDTPEAIELRFEVQDTGIGIPEEAMPRLFGRFEQTDTTTTRRYGGSGLGLAITRKLAELMGGQAGASSTPGQGSLFWFTVQLSKAQATALPSPERDEQPGPALAREFAGRRLLLAEDEPINREVATMLLNDVGLGVDVAENGLQAVQLARGTDYAAILMDMQMPEMDGLQAAREIRRLPRGGNVPIIALTANAFSEDRVRCMEAGMNGFLSKPFKPDDLYAMLLTWLRAPAAD